MRAETAAAVATATTRLAEPERTVRWALLDGTWHPGGPELTPTFKRRRTVIARPARRGRRRRGATST